MATKDNAGFFESVLHCVADGVFTVDRDWRITSFNRAAERITGVPAERAIGRRCCDVFHASICEDGCAIAESFETGREVVDKPARMLVVPAPGRSGPTLVDRLGRQLGIRDRDHGVGERADACRAQTDLLDRAHLGGRHEAGSMAVLKLSKGQGIAAAVVSTAGRGSGSSSMAREKVLRSSWPASRSRSIPITRSPKARQASGTKGREPVAIMIRPARMRWPATSPS